MNGRLEILDTPLQGLKVIQRKPVGDSRGYLERMFCSAELQSLIQDKSIVQINHTITTKCGTVRGMHFQHPPHAEIKFVSCLRGEVFDVAVDLRHNSPTFQCWFAEILSAENHKTLMIPEGYAHGFQTLTEDCELLYLHTAPFHPEAEGALNVVDPVLAIAWPLPVFELSERDRAHPFIDIRFSGIHV